jgi:hypothetical protein
MEDQTVIDQVAVSVTTTGVTLLGPGNGRRSITINSPVANRLTVSFGGTLGVPTLDQGINLYAGDPPLVLTRRDYGSGIDQPILAIMATAPETITAVVAIAAP